MSFSDQLFVDPAQIGGHIGKAQSADADQLRGLLAKLESDIATIQGRADSYRVGFVYVLSNIGASRRW